MKRGTGPMRRMGGGVDGRWNGMCVDGGVDGTMDGHDDSGDVDIHTP
jgi:hypothetical protein